MNLTNEVLAELRQKAEAATPGPWFSMGEFDTQHVVRDARGMICNTLRGNDEANANYIAALNPGVTLALLEEIADFRAAVDEAVRMAFSRAAKEEKA